MLICGAADTGPRSGAAAATAVRQTAADAHDATSGGLDRPPPNRPDGRRCRRHRGARRLVDAAPSEPHARSPSLRDRAPRCSRRRSRARSGCPATCTSCSPRAATSSRCSKPTSGSPARLTTELPIARRCRRRRALLPSPATQQRTAERVQQSAPSRDAVRASLERARARVRVPPRVVRPVRRPAAGHSRQPPAAHLRRLSAHTDSAT